MTSLDVQRKELRKIMAEQGFDDNGRSPHASMCEYPGRFPGYCTCVDDMIDAILSAGYQKAVES